ncbi:MAG: class I tRNA ligase family protein [Planctomycetaceae bacterium]
MEDRWVLSRLATTVREVTTMLDRYQFDQATRAVREFTWNEFCDWYLEMLKPRFRNDALVPWLSDAWWSWSIRCCGYCIRSLLYHRRTVAQVE